jgi:exopolyphosphatase/guanosine-5'-triphosphate,3'-diphosphate pyrophosphatase
MEPSIPPPENKAINQSEDSAAAKTVAAIDVGSNAIRMAIAQVLPDGRVEVLERLQRAVRMGQDTFRRGRLGSQSMRAAVAVMRDFKRLLDLYKVERVRAVTTSAVREAVNADNFLDRIFMATGLNVGVIATSEESRLTVSAVRQALGDALDVNRGAALIVDVGGGSTLLTLLEEGEIANSVSLRLGSIRLQEMLATSEEPPQRSAEMLRQHIGSVVTSARRSIALENIHSFVAVGGDVRFAAREAGRPTASTELYTVSRDDFDKLVRRCVRHTPDDLAKRYGLPFAEAETLNPALLVYQYLLHLSGAGQMLVSRVSMRDGLILEIARSVTGEEDPSLIAGILHSTMTLAQKYKADQEHAERVANLSVRLFDDLHADHGLGPRQRLLLRVAALLHEVGGYVSSLAHHKHSYYLISNSELFGLNRDEIQIVAHIARYHRRSVPKLNHMEYMALPRESRVIINKLAALLRVADAISRGNPKQVAALTFERQGDELIIHVPRQVDFVLEQRALAVKGDMFEDVYGMKVRLEEA